MASKPLYMVLVLGMLFLMSLLASGIPDAMNPAAYNAALDIRDKALLGLWTDMKMHVHDPAVKSDLWSYVTDYKLRASLVLDQFEISVCGVVAPGGDLLVARKAVLAEYDDYFEVMNGSPGFPNQSAILSPFPLTQSL